MRIPDPPLDPARIAEFARRGYWTETTSNDVLERLAREAPDKVAIVDGRMRFGYGDYFGRAERLAAYLAGLGLGADDVIAIQLPSWNEFPIAVNAAMLAGIPFCQFHSDFRSREVEFILSFTEASALILPRQFRRFDYLAMIGRLRPSLPHLRHVMVVGGDVPRGYFDCAVFSTPAHRFYLWHHWRPQDAAASLGAMVRIERSLEETAAGLRFKPPRTRRGRRTVSLPANVVEILRAHRRRQAEQRLILGLGRPGKDDLVFAQADAPPPPYPPDKLSRDWLRLSTSRKLPRVMFRALRHSHVSALIAAG